MIKRRKHLLVGVLASGVCLGALATTPAVARTMDDRVGAEEKHVPADVTQDAAAQARADAAPLGTAEQTAEPDNRLEDIVVTARKRRETTQNVATSIRAFSGTEAQQLGLSRPVDVATQTPGLNAKNTAGLDNPVFTMRGVGLNDVSAINNPTVGIYIDDVFIPYVPMMGGQIFDVDRIEVLKGPQGSLYGRNTTGGAIKFVSKRPTDELSADFRADYSSWSTLEVEGAISGPLTDTLKGRVALISRQRQSGYQYNLFDGRTYGRQDRMAGRALLDWSPTAEFDAELNLHFGRSTTDAVLKEHIGFVDPVTGVITCPAVLRGDRGGCKDRSGYADTDNDPFTSSHNNLYGDEITSQSWGGSLTLNYKLPFATLTAISGYDWFKRHLVDDNDSSPAIQFEIDSRDRIQVFSQEVRLVSTAESGPKWVVGGFYSWDRTAGRSEQAVDKLYSTRVAVTNDQTTKAIAAFGNLEFPITEQISLNGGLRYTKENKTRYTKSEDLASLGNISVLNPTHGPFVYTNQTQSLEVTDLSGNVGVQFKPSKDLMLYANAAKGFKSGGFKGAISFNPAQLVPYNPEELWAYEVGFKSTLFDGTMRFNAAAYYYDWKDFQAYSLVQLAVPVVVLTNAGDARIKGVEGEVVWRPSPRFRFSVAANYLDGKIVTFNALPGGTNNKGKKLSNAPDFTFAGVARYTAPTIGGTFDPYIQVNANYQSKVFFEIQNNPINSQSGYWVGGLRIGATTTDGRWDLAFYARNLFNKTYVSESRFIDLRTFPSSNIYGEPRSFGAAATFKF